MDYDVGDGDRSLQIIFIICMITWSKFLIPSIENGAICRSSLQSGISQPVSHLISLSK